MIILTVVFWGGLIALAVWGIVKLTGRGDSNPKRKPLEIAKERYARGEITRAEYEQLSHDLS